MKKLLTITISGLVALAIVGCEGNDVTTLDEVEPVIEETVEENIEEVTIDESEEVVEVEEVEIVEEKIDTFDYDELNYYLTTNLTDSEYKDYFERIKWNDGDLREIEFDAHVLLQTPSEKYKTRCELLIASGDFNNGEFTGPYIKTRDIGYIELKEVYEGSNVRVKATIEGYDMDRGYLKIDIKEIEVR